MIARDGFAGRLHDRRVSLGMSQTELAGEHMSASYISLLEAGKRAPTEPILAVLAARLGCTPTSLRDGEEPRLAYEATLTLEYAELALRNGEAADALTRLTGLMANGATSSAEIRWRARRLQAQALEAVGQLEESVALVETLRVEADATDRRDEYLRLTIAAVRCYKELGDLAYAIDIGERALATLDENQLGSTEEHAQLASALIGVYYERGDLVRASMLAERAIALVDEGGSRAARAAIYWNASLTAEAHAELPKALGLAERAIALYAEDDRARATARLRTAYGWLLLRSDPGHAEEAVEQLTRAHEQLIEVGSELDLAYCETELARCEVLRGDGVAALELTRSALSRLGSGVRIERSHTRIVEGRALLLLERHDEAIAAYRDAVQLMTGIGDRHAAGAWRELADAFTSLGMHADASRAFQHALDLAGVRGAPTTVSDPVGASS